MREQWLPERLPPTFFLQRKDTKRPEIFYMPIALIHELSAATSSWGEVSEKHFVLSVENP